MPNQFGLAGANPGKQTKLAPIYNGRWSSGLWTNRSPLRDAATTRLTEKYYGPAGDALISGSNVEITNRLTLARRPGNSNFPNETSPFLPNFGSITRFYDFRIFGPTTEQILIMVDQANSLQVINGAFTHVVWIKSPGAGQSYMQSVGNTLYFANGVDNKKWLQTLVQWSPNVAWNTPQTPYMSTFLIDTNGNIQQLTGTSILINSVFVQDDVVEIFTNIPIPLYQVLQVGQQVTFPFGMVASFLDGQTVTVTQVGVAEFIFNFITPDYAAATEQNRYATIFPGDGTPFSGSTMPGWNTSIPTYKNDFQGGITVDGTAQWTNRGSPVENWGIQPPTQVIVPDVQGSLNIWEAHTYYSLPGVIVDTNGNLQQVSVPGLSGSAVTWSLALNALTFDGLPSTGVTWKLIASAAMLDWRPNTYYPNGSFLISLASGTNCLFQLVASSAPYITGLVSAYLFPHAHSGDVGDFDLSYPTSLGSTVATANSLTGFNFSISGTGTGGSFIWNTVDSSGQTTGTTNPFPGRDVSDLNIIVTGTINVPVAGQYTFSVTHGDGLMWGIGGGALLISGSTPQNISRITTAANGYPVFQAGNNVNVTFNGGNAWVDQYVVQFNSAGTYPLEFNLARWDKPNAQLVVHCNGNVMASGQPVGTGGFSGNIEPTWPAFTLADAPAYPSVTESAGLLQWNNLGPAADFAWFSGTNYTLPNTTIVDPNGFKQGPYETGRTATSAPTFSVTLNALTADPNPNLQWINQGKSTAPPAGSISTTNGGWVYAVSLVNTLDDTVSNATPISAPTGNFTGAIGVRIPPGAGLGNIQNIDPQADYVAIWRSTDGQSQPFLIPGNNDYSLPVTIPLGQYLLFGYFDTTPDTGLNNLIEAPILGQNTPPAKGAANLTYYLNRIFYSVGNVVDWTSGPDTPAGNGFNGSSPLNFDEQQSLVHRIVPTTGGAVVFTVSDINLITSSTTSAGTTINPAVPFVEGVGLSSYNALDTNGALIGFFSTDNQFLILDPANGVSSSGFPIGDQFRLNNGAPGQSWNPANVYVAWHVNGEDQAWYVADGKYGWYRLMATPAPESGGFTWSPFATIVPGCKCVQSIETSPGVHNLLLGPVSSGHILARNLNSNLDGTMTYPASAIIGSAVLAQPGQYAVVAFITTESVRVGTPLVLGMLVDEAFPYYTGPFDLLKNWKQDPPNLRPSLSIYGQRFYLSELEEDAAMMRHCQMQVTWAAENIPNELLTLTIFGGFIQDE